MMKITKASLLELIKKLRAWSGAGILDCKKALLATNLDIKAAFAKLKEQGMIKANTKALRQTNTGGLFAFVSLDQKTSVIFELQTETDFVVRNEQFQKLAQRVGQVLTGPLQTTQATPLPYHQWKNQEKQTISNLISDQIAVIGENIVLTRINRWTVPSKKEPGLLFVYHHHNFRLAAMAQFAQVPAEYIQLATDITLHIATMQPQYLDWNSIDPQIIAREQQIQELKLAKDASFVGKNPAILKKIVQGRVHKVLNEQVLLQQKFVMDQNKTVAQALTDANLKLVRFFFLNLLLE